MPKYPIGQTKVPASGQVPSPAEELLALIAVGGGEVVFFNAVNPGSTSNNSWETQIGLNKLKRRGGGG